VLSQKVEELKQIQQSENNEVAEANGSMGKVQYILEQRTTELQAAENKLRELQGQLLEQTQQVRGDFVGLLTHYN
jgi:hypothetical protein